MKPILSIKNLAVSIEDREIIKNFNLEIEAGSIHALMGPNGSGKSSLANTLMGHPRYSVKGGTIFFNEIDITNFSPDKRAKQGLFLAFQYPQEIPGVQVFTFLKEVQRALTGNDIPVEELYDQLCNYLQLLSMDESFAYRNVNEGFSGGEKKRFELLQLLMLKPKLAILDEIDSGLDVDALKVVAHGLAIARKESPNLSILLITHYQRILNYIEPDFVHVMQDGYLIKSGDASLAQAIDQEGYDGIRSTQ
jgi:Fe-S cluster assembly ATP-binding protein